MCRDGNQVSKGELLRRSESFGVDIGVVTEEQRRNFEAKS